VANRRKKTSASTSLNTADSPVNQRAVPRDDRASDEEIRSRAYDLYLARGGGNGNEVEDWLRAENEFRQRSRAG
jgi:hypothetical protein